MAAVASTHTQRALIVAAVVFCLALALPVRIPADFWAFYVAGRAVLDGNLAQAYTAGGLRAQIVAAGGTETDVSPYLRPPFHAVFMVPLAFFPVRAAFWLWIWLQVAVLGECLWWARAKFGRWALILGLFWYPLLAGLSIAQDGALILGSAVAGFALYERGKPFWAGLVWSLGLVKLNVVWLLPLGLVAGAQWAVLGGFAAGGLGLLGLSALAMPPLQWLNVIGQSPHVAVNGSKFINLHTAVEALGLPALAWGLLGLLAVLLVVMASEAAPLWRIWLASVLAGLLLTPYAFLYDGAVLLLGAWLTFAYSESWPAKAAAGLYALPLVPWLTQVGGAWAAVPPLVLLTWLAAITVQPCLCADLSKRLRLRRPSSGATEPAFRSE